MSAEAQVRVVKVPEASLRIAIQESVWGAHTALFKKWAVGDYIVFLTSDGLAAVGRVAGLPFESDLMIWEKAIYPHRIPITFSAVLPQDERPTLGKKIRGALLDELGSGYGMRILRQSALPSRAGVAVLGILQDAGLLQAGPARW